MERKTKRNKRWGERQRETKGVERKTKRKAKVEEKTKRNKRWRERQRETKGVERKTKRKAKVEEKTKGNKRWRERQRGRQRCDEKDKEKPKIPLRNLCDDIHKAELISRLFRLRKVKDKIKNKKWFIGRDIRQRTSKTKRTTNAKTKTKRRKIDKTSKETRQGKTKARSDQGDKIRQRQKARTN